MRGKCVLCNSNIHILLTAFQGYVLKKDQSFNLKLHHKNKLN